MPYRSAASPPQQRGIALPSSRHYHDGAFPGWLGPLIFLVTFGLPVVALIPLMEVPAMLGLSFVPVSGAIVASAALGPQLASISVTVDALGVSAGDLWFPWHRISSASIVRDSSSSWVRLTLVDGPAHDFRVRRPIRLLRAIELGLLSSSRLVAPQSDSADFHAWLMLTPLTAVRFSMIVLAAVSVPVAMLYTFSPAAGHLATTTAAIISALALFRIWRRVNRPRVEIRANADRLHIDASLWPTTSVLDIAWREVKAVEWSLDVEGESRVKITATDGRVQSFTSFGIGHTLKPFVHWVKTQIPKSKWSDGAF